MRHVSVLPGHVLVLFTILLSLQLGWGQDSPLSISAHAVSIDSIQLKFHAGVERQVLPIRINQQPDTLIFESGVAVRHITPQDDPSLILVSWNAGDNLRHRLYHWSQMESGSVRWRHIPLWLSILPPLVAIGLALLFREVLPALFAGVWVGAFIASGLQVGAVFTSFFKVIDTYIIGSLYDTGHLAVIVFSLLIGGMVAIISRNGGMAGLVKGLTKYATNAKRTQLVTWLLGVSIFFDDYANTLIVGNTMRSVTDRFRISREKLAYIVDSTAAPVAAVAFITTWIGAELGYIETSMAQMHSLPFETSAYALFLESLKYSFYPVFTLAFILIIILTRRDYGPMWRAEQRAATTGQVSPAPTPDEDEPNMEDLSPVAGAPMRWYHAAIPVLSVILMTIYGLLDTGFFATFQALQSEGANITSQGWGNVWNAIDASMGAEATTVRKLGLLIGNADSYTALLWASITGVVLALVLTLSARTMSLLHTMDTLVRGIKTMIPAVLILTLAWSLAITTEELHTAEYLTSVMEGSIQAYFLPATVFVLAALISFSTGSSWSTMAILYPIAIPAAWAVSQAQGVSDADSFQIMIHIISVVLAASVLGDHCSPISDTTILSSLASDCNHIDHVRTQLPYALTVGAVSLIACIVSAFANGQTGIVLLCYALGLLVLYSVVRLIGRPTAHP